MLVAAFAGRLWCMHPLTVARRVDSGMPDAPPDKASDGTSIPQSIDPSIPQPLAHAMTPAELQALRDQRATAYKQLRDLVDAAEKRTENRGQLSAEEQTQYDRMNGELDQLDARIERQEKLGQREAWSRTETQTRTAPPEPGSETRADTRGEPDAEIRAAFREISDDVADELRADPDVQRRCSREYRRSFRTYMRGGFHAMLGAPEARAMQVDSDVVGGFLVAPMQFVAALIVALKNSVFVRRRATVMPVTTSDSLGVPTLDADAADPVWTSEIETGDEDDSLRFGRRELHPHPLAKRIKVSNKLLRSAALNPEAIALDRLEYKFATTMENSYLNGTGQNQPLGVMVPSDQLPAARDSSEDMLQTDFTADALISAQHALKFQYWGRASWTFHRDAMKRIRKLKTGEGQYLWQPGLQAGQASMILDMPYDVSEYMPNTFTTGKYVGLLGDWSYYWIADSLQFSVQRLIELYAEKNQVGLIARAETDGMPVLAEAFVRLKTA